MKFEVNVLSGAGDVPACAVVPYICCEVNQFSGGFTVVGSNRKSGICSVGNSLSDSYTAVEM